MKRAYLTHLNIEVQKIARRRRPTPEDRFAELERDPEYVASGLALEIAEAITRLMEERGMTRAELAQAMGVAPTFVSRMLNAPPNMTLQTIARCSVALQAELKLTLTQKGVERT